MLEDEFGMFDLVALKNSFWDYDIDGCEVRLRKGKRGCVLRVGEEPGTLIVEFKIGRGMKKSVDYTAIEVEAESLEIVATIGSRFSEPNPCLAEALAIRAGTSSPS